MNFLYIIFTFNIGLNINNNNKTKYAILKQIMQPFNAVFVYDCDILLEPNQILYVCPRL